MRIETVTSAQNTKIKTLSALEEKSSLRRESGLFVVEGRREIERCLSYGCKPKSLFLCGEILPESEMKALVCKAESLNPSCRLIQIPRAIYDKVAYRGGTEGVIAEMEARPRTLEELKLRDDALVMVLEAVEKPGNLGAILRSADATGVDAVLICDPLTDLYNPNLLRASLGAAFSVPIATCTSEEAIIWLKAKDIKIYTAQLQDSSLYYDTDLTGPSALVMGTEATGLSDVWREAADRHIRLPMLGICDSLNVSVSAAVLLYEALRQRQNPPQNG